MRRITPMPKNTPRQRALDNLYRAFRDAEHGDPEAREMLLLTADQNHGRFLEVAKFFETFGVRPRLMGWRPITRRELDAAQARYEREDR